MKELGATLIDPVTGLNRFISGDSSRVSEKPAEMVPTHLGGRDRRGRALARFQRHSRGR